VIDGTVDICRIADHHCLSFLFIRTYQHRLSGFRPDVLEMLVNVVHSHPLS